MRFLVNGSIAFDLLLNHEGSFLTGLDPKALEKLSVNYLAQGFVRHHGGTAANIGWHLALLGHQPLLLSAVGSDGKDYLTLLNDNGVDVSRVSTRTDSITATAVIATDSGERQISFFHPGADGLDALPDISTEAGLAYAIMSPRNPLLMLEGAAVCQHLKIPYLFDPGQVVHAFGADELRRAVTGSAGLIVNEYEWGLASSKLGWNEKAVAEHCGMLIITLGEKGIRFVSKENETIVPVCPTKKLVNPTGAGDAARAGLLHGFASGWSLTDSGRLGAILGCLIVEQEGTLLQSFDLQEVQKRAQQAYGSALPLR
jgi:adenosine kinase